nr:hypothetical protein [Deltaproteobacteria bacterium]
QPQPGDKLIVLLLPVALIGWYAPGRLGKRAVRAVRALFWFIIYVVFINLFWSLMNDAWSIKSKDGYLISPMFYIFDAFVFLMVLVLYDRYKERFLTLTVKLVLVSVVFQTFMTFVYTRGSALRSAGLFNQPNQLGYFAILAASILLLGQHRFRGLPAVLTPVQALVGQLCATYLALLSASKAALVSVAILGLVAVINRLRTLVVLGIVAAFFIFVANPFESAIERSTNRISNDQTMGFFEERGYDRLVQHPEWLLFGGGEGEYMRFKETSSIGSHELHSSIGTLVFCYGLAGTFLFFVFLHRVVKGASWTRLMILGPPAAFGLTHQGLRFTMLWVMLGIVVMLNEQDAQAQKARALGKSGT